MVKVAVVWQTITVLLVTAALNFGSSKMTHHVYMHLQKTDSKRAKAAAGPGSADKSSAEKAERTAAAQIGARVKIIWPQDRSFYSADIVVGDPGCCGCLAV